MHGPEQTCELRGAGSPIVGGCPSFPLPAIRPPAIRLRTIRLRALLVVALLVVAGLVAAGCGGGDREARSAQSENYQARAEGIEAEDPEGALALYREASRRHPTEAWPWAGLGRTSLTLGRWSDAEEAFRTAARWDSTRTDVQQALAELLLDEGRPEEALTWMARAHVGRDGDGAALALEGRILAAVGRTGEARKLMDRAVTLSPDDPRVRATAAFGRVAADSAGPALVELEALARRWPNDADVALARAAAFRALGRNDAARDELVRVLSLDPHRYRARRELARIQMEAGDARSALDQWRTILEASPGDAVALEGLGSCALATGDEGAAEEAFRRAIEADPEFAPAYLALGRFLARAGRDDESVPMLRKARARASLDEELWEECSLVLGEAYLGLGEAGNALDIADSILGRRPGSNRARALRGRALAAGGGGASSPEELERTASRPEATRAEILAYTDWLLANGDPARALSVTESYLGRNPGDRGARVRRARANIARGDEDAAEAELHDVLAEEANSPEAHLALAALYLAQERLPDALFHANEGTRLSPDNPDFAILRGRIAMAERRWEDARIAFERERELRPESPGPWLNLGRLEMELGRPSEAAPYFERARDLDVSDWQAPYLLGLAETGAGRTDGAVEAYRTALARNERLAEAHNNLAWLLADLDLDPVLAEVHARRAAELQPENPDVLGTLGWALYKNRLLVEAEGTLSRATGLRPDDPMKRYMHGVVLFHQGRSEDARQEVQEALRLDPGFSRAANARELLRRIDS